MKRLFALLLVFTLLLSVCSVTAFATNDEQSPVEGEAKFYDRFEQIPSASGKVVKYKELYYHYTDPQDESTLDWALVFGYRLYSSPTVIKREIGGRLFCAGSSYSPFDLCYGVYDVKKDKFMSLYDGILDSYEGLREVVYNLELEAPVKEFGQYDFWFYLNSLDQNATFSGYRVLSYQIGKMYHAPYEFTVNWALLKVDCEPSSAQPDTRALDFTIKDKRLVAKEPTWPFGSKLAVYIPEGKDEGFHALDELDLSEFEGLEDAILSQDLEGLGIDVSPAGGRFFDRFVEYYDLSEVKDDVFYSEDYTHFAQDDQPDWVIVRASAPGGGYPIELERDIAGRIVCTTCEEYPFELGYGVYDVKQDKFMTLSNEILPDYDGMAEAFQTLDIQYPAWEYGSKELTSYLMKLDAGATFSGYRNLAYQSIYDYQHYPDAGVKWMLVRVDCEPSSAQPDTRALDITIKDKRLVAKVPTWPFGSKLAVYIPEGKDRGFHALDELDLSEYEGLEDAILSQDLESLGIEVSDKEYVCSDKFEAWMKERHFDKYDPDVHTDNFTYRDYDELFIHRLDENGEIDWVLVQGHTNDVSPFDYIVYMTVGSRVLRAWTAGLPSFPFGYFVYDVAEDDFYPIEHYPDHGTSYPTADLDKYPGIVDAFEELQLGFGYGDADMDGNVSIIDATFIQKYKAELKDASELCLGAADVDGDGVVSVIDATKIQKHLAGIE